MRGVPNTLKSVSLQALIVGLTVILLDTALFFSLPESVASRFPGYREGFYVIEVIGRGYPKDYFEPHPERGFDIRPTAAPRTDQIHNMDEYSYPVWSNNIGCFDKPVDTSAERFWYMAGDSIAWGHAKFEDLMGTILEKIEGVEILQCGVTHSGQRHQFSKFLEIGKKLGRWPERVLIFYSPTDVANDYLYPHSTVVDGGLADIRMLDINNNAVELDQGWFDQVKARREADKPSAEGQPTTFSLPRFLMTYSITAQFLNIGLHAIDNHLPWLGKHIGVLGEEPGLEWYDKYFVYQGRKIYDIHRLTHFQTLNGYLAYADFSYADQNKAIIKKWRAHALANGYKLEFVLPPPGPSTVYVEGNATKFYKEFIAFLSSQRLQYYDLIAELEKREIETDDLYWEQDLHMSNKGNRIVGKILAELL